MSAYFLRSFFYTMLMIPTATVNAGNPEINPTDTTQPCEISRYDSSLFNIVLLDSRSSVRQVGSGHKLIDDHKDMIRKHFCNQDRTQTMTLFFHYGGSVNEVAEFQVKRYATTDSASVITSAQTFISGQGIRLGLSREQVESVFGTCYQRIISGTDTETIRYISNHFNESPFLQRFNYPEYYAEYEFRENKLIRFRFGFTYP